MHLEDPPAPPQSRPITSDLRHGAVAMVGQLVVTPFVVGAVLGNPAWFTHWWRVREMWAPGSHVYTVAALAGVLAAAASYGTRLSVKRVELAQRAAMVGFVAPVCAWGVFLSFTDPPIVVDVQQLWRVALLGAIPGFCNLLLVVREYGLHFAGQGVGPAHASPEC